jgi:type VII secretion integral membrane protein EccD
MSGLGAPELLAGSAALLLFSVFGYFGVISRGRLFVAGALAGLFGVIAGLLAQRVSAAGVAAVAAVVLIAAAVSFPLLSMRLGKLPLPAVPQTAADLMANPIPNRDTVFAAVARADELLTGMLIGTAVVQAVSAVVLVARGGTMGAVLAGVVGLLNLLRARQYLTVRHRLPLLVAGLAGLIAVAAGMLAAADPGQRLVFGSIGVLVLGGLILAAALAYSRRPPTPYLGRAAEILDVLLIVVVVPLACAVLGLFDFVRGFGG